MNSVKLIIRNLQQFDREIQKADEQRVKAARTATKVEAFRLMKLLKREIRAGAPGGQPFSPLTEIAKRTSGKGLQRKALKKLATPIRYATQFIGGLYTISVGFVDPGKGPGLSKSWKRIATKLQQGGTISVDENLRRALLDIGTKLRKRRRPEAKYFFLPATKTTFRIPARPILDPFWRAHEHEVFRNICQNFERKMAGERI